jgi:hypothetical protein
MDCIGNWLARLTKKGPFWLYSSEEMLYGNRSTKGERTIPGWRRRVIWREGNKTKIGILHDGMWVRYGIKTYGVLKGTTATGLWQSTPGTVTESELHALLDVAAGNHSFPRFDPAQLQDVQP